MSYIPLYARYDGQHCPLCGRLVLKGDPVAWTKGQPVRHWWCHEKTAHTVVAPLVSKDDIREIECPRCGAGAGERCIRSGRAARQGRSHVERMQTRQAIGVKEVAR